MAQLSVKQKKCYWQSLIRQEPVPDPRLYPGLVAELRAALRDAMHEIPEQQTKRWRGEWVGKC